MLVVASLARPAQAAAPVYQVQGQTVRVCTATLKLELQIFAPGTVRVWRAPVDAPLAKTSLSVIKPPEATAKFAVSESLTELAIKTSRLLVALNLRSGAVRFATLAGAPLLREAAPADSLFTPPSTWASRPTWCGSASPSARKRRSTGWASFRKGW